MLFLTPEMKKAFDAAAPFPDELFYTSPEMKPISDERSEIDEEINASFSDAQYGLMRRLVRNFIAENQFEFAYYFAQGWQAALAAHQQDK